MAGISDQAAMMPENKQLFNDGSELQHEEFSDGTGLDWYNMPYRNYDPQIGVFHNIDPMPSDMISPYSYAIDNPLMFEDPSGATEEQVVDLPTIFDNLDNSQYGGSWSSDGGGDGSYDYFSSNADAFEATAFSAMSSGYGEWGTNPAGAYAGAFYNYVTSTGNVDIPNYATFRSEFFQTLPGVTINVNDPASWAAAQNTILNELEQSLNSLGSGNDNSSGYNIAGIINDAAGLSFDATRYSAMGVQMLGNSFGGTSYAIQDIGKLRLARFGNLGGITFEGAGKILGVAGMGLTAIDMINNGVNWTNGTDLVMEGVAFIPVVGWAISGVYFISDIVVEHYTGESIGQHLGDLYNDPIVQEGIHQQSIMPPTF